MINYPENRKCKHGFSGTHTHRIWQHLIQRCTNPNNPRYKDYGGRGIKVCKRWRKDFRNFLKDMGICPPDRSIDRIDNNGDYRPGNCRWATPSEQQRNRRPRNRKSPGSVPGCHFHPRIKAKPWGARITINGVYKHLGYFATEEEAAEAIKTHGSQMQEV